MDDLIVGADDGRARCGWCGTDPLYVAYHDDEWGRPVTDDTRLFEKLCLEGFQAGLSWITILRKRPAFRAAFAAFDMATVAGFDEADVARLLGDAGIVRHRGKITAAVANADRALALIDEVGSLSAHVRSFVPEAVARRPRPARLADVPATTAESSALSADLKRRGWRFVGPTTVYAFMQAMGLVDDHLEGCWVPPGP
ncbi:DNA-3-methyladenine glycosylase I [Iamia sp.]|uniref:DNA-3-methyladenine glycosylase I n=1 Tax=Iamia sp. TaxID=2722710 RepID=UPI002D05786C|nr:DNA-3-methyladenine glycosylase I [Iamia sp.]HXH57132.1 DNA-3-methyladenine glycosylase I [Iamia sp.]